MTSEREPAVGPTEPPDPHGETSYHLRRAVEGDAGSMEEVVRRLSPLLLALASYRLKSLQPGLLDPADLVNEIWLRSLPRLRDLMPRDGRLTPVALSYLGTAMRRRVRDLLEMQLRRSSSPAAGPRDEDPAAWMPADTQGVVTRVVGQELRGLVRQAIDELSPQDREVVLLRGIEQASTREVAAVVGISEDAVKQRYRRALQRLRERLPGSVFFELESAPFEKNSRESFVPLSPLRDPSLGIGCRSGTDPLPPAWGKARIE